MNQYFYYSLPKYLRTMMKVRNCKPYEIITVSAVSVLVIKFTDIGFKHYNGELYSTCLFWKLMLSLSSASPWTFRNAYNYLQSKRKQQNSLVKVMNEHESTADDLLDYETVQHNKYNLQFIIHDLIHNFIAIFYHAYPMQFLAWLGLINFPFWFSLIDQAMTRKEMGQDVQTVQVKIDFFGKILTTQNQDPLYLFAVLIYIFGSIIRGTDYLLSASCLVNLCLPFVRRKLTTGLVNRGFVLGVLFLLEHLSIQYKMHSYHNVVHILSHFAIASFVNEIYVAYFDNEVKNMSVQTK